jgi:putative phosphonate metabolism protein
MNTDRPYRAAIYFAPPPGSAAWQAGSRWLGRDAATNAPLPQPRIDGVEACTLAQLTAEPRRYGWHATLKPPFRLRQGLSLDALDSAVYALCREWRPVPLPALRVARLRHFLALRPEGDTAPVNALAAACVQRLHALAQPLNDAELARRRRAGLSPHQDELLRAWGYPWVLDEFRFHCSLTGDLRGTDEAQVQSIERAAQEAFDQLPAQPITSLAVFIEREPGADFVLHQHWELNA